MSQYNTGTVNIRSVATSDIHGLGTAWSAAVSAGDLFKIDGSDVIYTVASITGDSDLTLSSNYVGPVGSGIQYQITRDFTPNYNFAEIHRGDYDWPIIVTQSLRDIDNQIHSDSTIIRSDIASLASDAIYDRLFIAANTSDTTAARSDVFNGIRDAIIAFGAMDTTNVSDLVVGIGEILSAFSDVLPYN